jgi:hypothetical protein
VPAQDDLHLWKAVMPCMHVQQRELVQACHLRRQ